MEKRLGCDHESRTTRGLGRQHSSRVPHPVDITRLLVRGLGMFEEDFPDRKQRGNSKVVLHTWTVRAIRVALIGTHSAQPGGKLRGRIRRFARCGFQTVGSRGASNTQANRNITQTCPPLSDCNPSGIHSLRTVVLGTINCYEGDHPPPASKM